MREFSTYILRTSLTSFRNKENILAYYGGSETLRVSVSSVLDSSGYIYSGNRRVLHTIQISKFKMPVCDYTISQHHRAVAPTGWIHLPINVTGNIPNCKRVNEAPVIKSCEIALGIRDVSLQVRKILSHS